MSNLSPYLMFDGDCEEAMHFYQAAFGGQLSDMMRFGDGQMGEVPEEAKNRVMHSVLTFWGGTLMASDTLLDDPPTTGPKGTRISLNLDFEEISKMESTFESLREGGQVTMALQDTFWGSRFGMIKDKYGINWMFSCPLEEARAEN